MNDQQLISMAPGTNLNMIRATDTNKSLDFKPRHHIEKNNC